MNVETLVSGLLSMSISDGLGIVGLVIGAKWVLGRISATVSK